MKFSSENYSVVLSVFFPVRMNLIFNLTNGCFILLCEKLHEDRTVGGSSSLLSLSKFTWR